MVHDERESHEAFYLELTALSVADLAEFVQPNAECPCQNQVISWSMS